MKRKFLYAAGALLLALLAAYSNYFASELHRDDFAAIRDNTAIRSLANMGRFLTDDSTSSTLPAGYAYRPFVTASLAIDYALGRGAPWAFHVDSFLVFVAGLGLIGWMYLLVFERAMPHPLNALLALFAAALFGLHPVAAEMLNVLSQRGEVYAALGVVGGVAIYAAFPLQRQFCLYLIPPLLGILANPEALIFGPLLLAYILLIEPAPSDADQAFTADQMKSRDETQAADLPKSQGPTRVRIRRRKHPFRRYLKAQFKRFLPTLAFTAGAAFLEWLAMPGQLFSPGASPERYWITQPWVAWRYFLSFFAPFHLGPVSDLAPFSSFDSRAVAGMVFLLFLTVLALSLLAADRKWRPVAFGIWWFLLGLAPGSMLLHAEVESDRRMFLPFIGLVLGVTWAARLLLPANKSSRRLEAYVAIAVLAALGMGTFARNRVWRTDATLWRDNLEKNPASARAVLNYAIVLASQGLNSEAYADLERAHRMKPDLGEVETNLGSVAAALGRDVEAEEHFRLGRKLAPDDETSYLPHAVWLEKQGRPADALAAYTWAAAMAPSDLRPRYGQMRLYAALLDWDNLRDVVEASSKLAPGDPGVTPFVALSKRHPNAVKGAEQVAADQPTPENYRALADAYCLAARYDDCLKTAQKAIQLRPGYAEAYNTLGAAYVSLNRIDEGIAAVKKALQLDPDSKNARTNLMAWESLGK